MILPEKKVVTLADEMKSAGHHEVKFDASALASGMYFYRLQSGRFMDVKRLMVLK